MFKHTVLAFVLYVCREIANRKNSLEEPATKGSVRDLVAPKRLRFLSRNTEMRKAQFVNSIYDIIEAFENRGETSLEEQNVSSLAAELQGFLAEPGKEMCGSVRSSSISPAGSGQEDTALEHIKIGVSRVGRHSGDDLGPIKNELEADAEERASRCRALLSMWPDEQNDM